MITPGSLSDNTASPQLCIFRFVHYFAFVLLRFHLSVYNLNGLVCMSLHSVENQDISPNHSIAKIPDVHMKHMVCKICRQCTHFSWALHRLFLYIKSAWSNWQPLGLNPRYWMPLFKSLPFLESTGNNCPGTRHSHTQTEKISSWGISLLLS